MVALKKSIPIFTKKFSLLADRKNSNFKKVGEPNENLYVHYMCAKLQVDRPSSL